MLSQPRCANDGIPPPPFVTCVTTSAADGLT